MHGPFCRLLLHTLEAGDRFDGGGDEALLAVVNQRHARSGQVEHLSHLFGQVVENVTDAVTAREGGGEPLQAVEKCVGIGHNTSPVTVLAIVMRVAQRSSQSPPGQRHEFGTVTGTEIAIDAGLVAVHG